MTNITLQNAYNPINPESKFDALEFASSYQRTNGLEKTLEMLKHDANDLNSIKNAGALTFGNPDFYNSIPNAGMMARYATEKASEEGNQNLIQYTVKNSKDLYGLLNEKDKMNLTMSSEVLKVKNEESKDKDGKADEKGTSFNKEYNHFADLANLYKGLNEVANKDTPEAKNTKITFIAEQSQYSPRWMQEMNQSFSSNQKYLDAIFQEYIVQVNNDYTKIILTEDGQINNEKITKFSDVNFGLHNTAKEKDFDFFKTLKDLGFNSIVRTETEKAKAESEKKKAQATNKS